MIRDRDLSARIAAHPHLAVGIAFGLGALLGCLRAKSPVEEAEVKRGLIGAAMATFGALAFRVAKNVAFHHLSSQLSSQARSWWERRYANVWQMPDLESFLDDVEPT
jgi:hypothetical protein